MRFLTISLLLVFLIGCNGSNSTDNILVGEKTKQRIDSTLSSFVELGRAAGTSALIYEKGNEVYFSAYGKADRLDDTDMDRETIVQIFSMTKPITGVALLQLYEQGMFDLDDPLHQYIPEFESTLVFEGLNANGKPILVEPNRPITVRDITRHTAGFANSMQTPYVGKLLSKANLFDFNNSLEEVVTKLAELPLIFHPGEEWYYGPSVDVQAYLVEKLSGQPFEEYITEHILEPLGMTETRYFVPMEDRSRMSSTYSTNEIEQLVQIPDEQAHELNINSYPLTPGGWGLTSTLDDYMTFARMLLNKGSLKEVQILKPETVELMATNQLSEDVTERLWLPSKGRVGFGIDVTVRLDSAHNEHENVGAIGEFFWDGAATTLFWVDPKNELAAVFFVQKFPFDGTLHKDFRDAVYGKCCQ